MKAVALISAVIIVAGASQGSLVDRYNEYSSYDRRVTVTEFLTGEPDDGEEPYLEDVEGFFSSLPDSLSGVDLTSDPATAAEKYDFSYFSGILKDKVRGALSRFVYPFLLLTVLCLVSFLVKNLCASGGVGRAAATVVRCAAALSAISSGVVPLRETQSFLADLSTVTGASAPACAALLVAGGRVSGAAVNATYLALISTLIEKIFQGVVLPLIASSLALITVECAYPGHAVKLSSFPLTVAKWISVVTASVASIALGAQSFLSSSADTVGVKTLKFALGSAVPLVGGAVGDSVSFITAGASSVKGAFGVTLIVIIFILVLTPLIYLLLGRAALGITDAVCGAVGEDFPLLKSLSGVLGALTAAVASACAVFLVLAVTFTSYGALI